ncbi:hypothetical protein A2U01_0080874, partial [Trifolium medium]|nr:hypothetical protein [Trifolium medium]
TTESNSGADLDGDGESYLTSEHRRLTTQKGFRPIFRLNDDAEARAPSNRLKIYIGTVKFGFDGKLQKMRR